LFIRQRIEGGDIDERVTSEKGRHDKGRDIDRAIDIGMTSNHGCFTTAHGRSKKKFRLDNTREGLDLLIRL
jgi:hypothetical protein